MKPINSWLRILWAGIELMAVGLKAQTGGQEQLVLLRLPASSRLTGLGMVNVTAGRGKDPNMVLANPALLTEETVGLVSVNYVPLPGQIRLSQVSAAWNAPKSGAWAASLRYLSYGQIEETDNLGNIIGSFQASEFALGLSKSYTIEHYTLGGNLQLAGSYLAGYSAYALMADIGLTYRHPENDLTAALVIKHAGLPLKKYTDQSGLVLPFDVQLGISFKPEKMPVRFSLTAQRNTHFDLAYSDPTLNFSLDANGNPIEKKPSFFDKFFRHFVIGTEWVLSEHFQVRAGYNYLVRRELRLENVSGGAGFSLGVMLKVKQLEFSYSHAWYHVAGGTGTLTLTANLKHFPSKKS